MATFRVRRRFALEPGGPGRIEVSWKQGLTDVRVRFDGEVVGRFVDEKELRRGGAFALPTGGTLDVRWIHGLRVRHDGKRAAEPIKFYEDRVHNAWLWAVANGVVAGWLASAVFFTTFSIFISAALGAEAAAMLVAAWFIREGSRRAILALIVITVVDAFLFLDESHAGRALGALVWKGLWIAMMISAYRAGKIVDSQRRRSVAIAESAAIHPAPKSH